MRTVLFVTPDLDYGGVSRQVCLLARGLSDWRGRFAARVCALGGPAPWAEALRRDGVPVEELGWSRRR